MGLLTFGIDVTLDGCVDHEEGIADDETHAFFTDLMDAAGAMLWGRVTYEMMESHWPAVARGDVDAPPAIREWATELEAVPKYVVSSTRTDDPWTGSHHLTGDLRTAVQALKDATPPGVLLGSGMLATELDRLGLIDEYRRTRDRAGRRRTSGRRGRTDGDRCTPCRRSAARRATPTNLLTTSMYRPHRGAHVMNEPVENFDVSVEKTDRGWIVVATADGERKELGDPHPDRVSADFYAQQVSAGAEMWDDGAQVDD